MMKKQLTYITGGIAMLALLAGCSSEVDEVTQDTPTLITFSVRSELVPMNGEPQTRISLDGSKFLIGDMIRLKAVTPYNPYSPEFGESTWGGTIDDYFLLRCTDEPNGDGYTSWTNTGFSKDDNLDLNGDGIVGDTSAPALQFESQQTPYVYTANTWNRSVGLVAGSDWRTIYKSTFYADQSIMKNFQASDLLWAQTMLQTCSDQVTLSFHHVMSELLITIPAEMTLGNTTLTLENMPDVDLQEFVVGDKFANKYYRYGDKLSYSWISYVGTGSNANGEEGDNGKVIGISYFNGAEYKLKKLTEISKTGNTYVAYRDAEAYRVIVPPMAFDTENAKIVLRHTQTSGESIKYEYKLKDLITDNEFKANTCYPIKLAITTSTGGGE